MKKLSDNSKVFYSYVYVHEDGFRQSGHYLHVLKKEVKEYKLANGLPIQLLFNQEFEDNLCRNSNPGCIDNVPPTVLEKATQLTQALYKWAKTGFKVRTEAEVERIRAVCQACPHYGGESSFLKVICKICGCSRLKVFLQGTICPDNPPRWQ